MSARTTFAYVPSSHLDLFWLGNYNTTLERGAEVIKAYLDRCLSTEDETFLLETTVFAEYFWDRYPEYREPLLQLVRDGRVEVGTVFVDRWEHLTPGESMIRNIQMGIQWCRDVLGIEPVLATHPDLPSLVPQTSQIYAQAGIKYYVTSRKVFEDGAVWRHVAPDGTRLLYLNWPRHYMYFPLNSDDLPRTMDGWGATGIDVEQTSKAFPLGVIPINGSAADLTEPASFKARYGDYLWNLVEENRRKYPQFDFTYTVPSAVLEPYLEVEGLPERHGEIPSVWGVACDEEVGFFRRNRELENLLLTAETVAAVAVLNGVDWKPESVDTWQGALYESAFYARKDPIPTDRLFEGLWRMHIFSEDHNGGGYEGALSSFQKRVIQERALDYANEIITTGLRGLAQKVSAPESGGVLLFNPLGRPWTGPVTLSVPRAVWDAGRRPSDTNGNPLSVQVEEAGPNDVTIQAWVEQVPSVGYDGIGFEVQDETPASGGSLIHRTANELVLETDHFRLAVDLNTGAVTHLLDLETGADWGHDTLFNITALREVGSDVTLRMDPEAVPEFSETGAVDIVAHGPLFTRIRLAKTILDAAVSQTITLWSMTGRIDVETNLRWWGARDWQLRLALPTAATTADIAYGTPFHGGAWTDVVQDAAPRNPDEILIEDYHAYREIQQWLHVGRPGAGLLMITSHPGVHYDNGILSAVLMRTSPSCGDKRLYWENAGEQVYRFTIFPTDGAWQAVRPFDLAAAILRAPVQVPVEARDGGMLPSRQSFLAMEADTAVLSSLSWDESDQAIRARIFEGTGSGSHVTLGGPVVENAIVEAVDLNDRVVDRLDATSVGLELAPWRIQTLRVMRQES